MNVLELLMNPCDINLIVAKEYYPEVYKQYCIIVNNLKKKYSV